VPQVGWSRLGGRVCIRLDGVTEDEVVQVRPVHATVVEPLVTMLGELVSDRAAMCFLPRYDFVPGTKYEVFIGGSSTTTLTMPRVDLAPTTEVIAIFPTAPDVPRNLLRFYVHFSAPMSEGYAADSIAVVDQGGKPMPGALLATEDELWDVDRRRLTLLLDPSRIKRGLRPHHELGYPLNLGSTIRLIVDEGLRDAQGARLIARAERSYQVASDERRLVDPSRWAIVPPSVGTRDALTLDFDRALDHGLLTHCLRVLSADGQRVQGSVRVGPGERSWSYVPRLPWVTGTHRIAVNPLLEDLGGNSLRRVFDRDLALPGQRAEDTAANAAELAFSPAQTEAGLPAAHTTGKPGWSRTSPSASPACPIQGW
jgi:hypothetical protein